MLDAVLVAKRHCFAVRYRGFSHRTREASYLPTLSAILVRKVAACLTACCHLQPDAEHSAIARSTSSLIGEC